MTRNIVPRSDIDLARGDEGNLNVRFYEQFARFYEQVYGSIDSQEVVRQWALLLKMMFEEENRQISTRLKLLDVGCGPGWYLWPWANAGFDVQGFDSSPAMLSRAGERYTAESGGGRCSLHAGDIRDLHGYGDLRGIFDVVTSHFNFLNLFSPDDLASVFRGMAHFVRSGGLWMTDYSCPRNPLTEVEETFVDGSRSAGFLRVGNYITERNCYELNWQSSVLDGREVYWFHNSTKYETTAGPTGWKVVGSFQWDPNNRENPWKPSDSASERIVSIFQRF